jgi:hypothetical protein
LRAVCQFCGAQRADRSVAAGWLLGEGRLDRVSTRDTAISRLLPDVLALLPNARSQRTAGLPSEITTEGHFGGGGCDEAVGATQVPAEDLAARRG